ncbi:BrxA family protein [Kribbella sp. VKM Ac-2566]|uniref:BrxA family protein n=1 Tax=Kribbella sp. VKM Ac-2566 TaxID=2512218 RepID=UPI00106329DA|nr:BrxA family protein [Kribbella sp. VKM Ac-2566]TDW98261.1 putative inner membrane protein DUF1819 [Kribbella sp. VKM Ac-2566]
MEITSRIIKGGALLEESRRFVETWDDTLSEGDNLQAFRTRNFLGKRSRSRAEDTLAILRQRLASQERSIFPVLRALTVRGDAFRDACYFEAARNDDLLAYIAGSLLYDVRDKGWTKVAVDDVSRALLEAQPAPIVAEWSESTRTRVVHGVLSALRDFGVLEGRAIKHIAPPQISFGGFVYVVGRLRQEGASAPELVAHNAWRWWLLDERQVRAHFLEADREGVLRFSEAGSTVRIDWTIDGLEEMIHAAA